MARVRRRTRRGLGLASLLSAGILLSACGSNAHAVAACKQVKIAISLYDDAMTKTGPAQKAGIAHAQSQLKRAMRDAGAATSEDGIFNSLQTTISESSRVGMRNVVPSLRAQCDHILDPNPYAPKGP